MPNRNYIRGRQHEYDVKTLLEKAGYTVVRSAGSHSLFDLVAIKRTAKTVKEVWLMQLKCHQVKHGE